MKKLLLLFFLLTFSLGQSQNQIVNGTFAAGAASWGIGSPGVVSGGEVSYPSSNPAGPAYLTEMYQAGMALTSNATYTVTFRARATTNRNISVSVQHRNTWQDSFRNDNVALTTTMTTYSYAFTVNPTGNAGNAQLNFHMAGFGNPAATYGVFIDDVSIMPGNVTATPCANGIQDNGETGVDCGGSCGPCLITPTFNAFTVGPKLLGDAPFTATATSDSPGAITYTSSATGVATINPTSGLVTIVGPGTTTITANQAASGGYYAGSITATLTVTPPAAPIPPVRNSWDVVSLYSNSYAPTSGATWQHGTDVSIGGNNARFFNGFTLARLAFGARSISAMTTLHIDVYTLNQNQLWFEINGNRKVVSSIPLNGWASFDIPLSDYVGLNLGNVSFFDLNNPTGAAAPVKVVYLDNIYFYRAATDTPPTIGALTVTSPQEVGNAPFTLTNPTSNSPGAWTYSSSPAGVVTISGNTVTIIGGGTTTITATQAAVPGSFGSGTATATLVVNFPAPGPSPIPPARNPIDVVSLYTGTPTTYANVVTATQASWSTGSTNSNFNFANGTNTCIQVNNLGFFGLVTNGANFSVASMNFLHVDIYVNTPMTSMILNLLAPSDRNYSIGPLATGWNSFDIPLTVYGTGFTNINGIKFEQSGGTPRQIYIDNVYFFNGTINPTISAFSIPAKAPNAATFTITPPTSNSTGAWSYTSSDNAVGQIVNGNQIQVGAGGSCTITATQAAIGNFNSGSITATFNILLTPTLGTFTVPAKVTGDAPFALTAPSSDSAGAFTYNISPAGIATISGSTVTIVGPGTATITATQAANGLYNSAVTTASLVVSLGTAATTPPVRNPWDVISFYSGAYTNTSPPNWAGGSDVTIAGNTTRLLSNYTLGTLNFASVNVSAMTTLHIDIYSVNQNPTWIRINGIQQFVATTPINGWTSLDIPLSSFTGANLAAVTSVVIFNPTGAEIPLKTAYIDNVYFYRPATDAPPTIGALTVPTPQVVGNAPFTLTNPTSDSSGAWTYSASPAGVVTFIGNTATIVGGGTTTITATQAAVPGSFGPASTTATLVVNYPDPTPSPALPERDPSRVVSLYTGTPAVYANAPNYNFGQAFWSEGGGRVLTEVPNGTNTALRIDGLGFMGLIDIGNPPPTNRERRINLVGTGMSHLNIDIYLDTPRPNLFLVLLAPSDRLYNTGALVAGWNRLRVPLTAYPGALNDIYGLKIEQNYTTPFRLFIDNVYFSNDLFTFYADSDGDGFGNSAATVLAETAPDGYVSNSTDCDDNDINIWQTGNFYIDFDVDGYSFDGTLYPVCYGASVESYYSLTSLGLDCDDFNTAVYRNGEFYADADGDGYSPTPLSTSIICYGAAEPAGMSLAVNAQVDCDDNSLSVYPGAPEVCFNNIDDDCDGLFSETCAPVLTNILPTYCGTTLANAKSTIGASIATYSGPYAVSYVFRITNLTATPQVTVDLPRAFRNFNLGMTNIIAYGSQYSVRVAAVVNGEQQAFSAPCLISTPSIPTTKLIQCGATPVTMTSSIGCNAVSYALGYQFEVAQASNPGVVKEFERLYSNFSMIMITSAPNALPLLYDTEYIVRVKVKVLIDGEEVWGQYGQPCTVTTPLAPEAFMAACGEEAITPASLNTVLYSNPISYATLYRFTLVSEELSYSQFVENPFNSFKLSDFEALETLTPGATYSIFVDAVIFGNYYPGKDCQLVVPFPARTMMVDSEFEAKAYPNPFANDFLIDVTTESKSPVNIKVYDMIGRLVDQQQIGVNNMGTSAIGAQYPSGVYNVVITQDEVVKTLRVVKR